MPGAAKINEDSSVFMDDNGRLRVRFRARIRRKRVLIVPTMNDAVSVNCRRSVRETSKIRLTGLSSATVPICLGGKRHLHESGQAGRGAVNWCARLVFL